MTHPDTRLATDSIIDHLTTETGLEVGDSIAPAASDRPYLVVYRVGAFVTGGPLRGASEDQWAQYQVTAVGDTREQAEWALGKARTAILDETITPPSGYVWGKAPIIDEGPSSRDDTWDPPLFYAVETYRLFTTPA